MLLEWLPWFVLSAILASLFQLALKKTALSFSSIKGFRFYLYIFKSVFLYIGVILSLLEMVVWVYILSYIPLMIAFPLTSIEQLVIIFFSFVFLKEKIISIEWVGIFLVVAGIILLGWA